MEVCARNLRGVPQPLVPLEVNEHHRRRFRPGIFVDKLEEEVVCPKPHRPCNPARRQRSSTPRGGDSGFEVLEILLGKSSYGDASSFGCSPPYFSGSPPARAGNPLVRDVQFNRQRATATPSPARDSSARSFSPCIRVEGFTSATADTISAVA